MGVGKKLFWVLVVLSSFAIAGFLCYTAIIGYLTTFVLVTIDDVSAPLDKVIFPAVVVCNMNQVRLRCYETGATFKQDPISILYPCSWYCAVLVLLAFHHFLVF